MPLASSVASVTSVANDKGDNEMILGAVHRSHGFCQLRDRLMKGLCDQSSLKWGPFPPNEVGRNIILFCRKILKLCWDFFISGHSVCVVRRLGQEILFGLRPLAYMLTSVRMNRMKYTVGY